MHQPSMFQVYNASAGSGKTYTLVKEYLKVLLNSKDLFRFQKVLAITFTNKAAAEMKARVLSNLEAFSEGEENDLFSDIQKETSIDKATIQDRSKRILAIILQNYAAFSITTIDSFTHKIIKNFAFDLGLSLNFEVEMDAVSLLNESVDVLISKIGTDQEVTKLLIDYTLEKTDDDKSWDISRDLNEFSKILLNEDDTIHFRRLADKTITDFTALKKKLNKQQIELKKQVSQVGERLLSVLSNVGLETKDFTRGTVPKFFADVSQKEFNFEFIKRSEAIEKAIDNNQYYTKKITQEKIALIEGVVPQIVTSFQKTKELFKQFLLNKLALKSLTPLAVLNHINLELTNIKEENNIRLNAEFNQLISDHIKEQPAPFIYERIGQKYLHYFIDEMQDTSVLQWQNLIPLIVNALAQENSNLLLVGDGKQAIYRWRGGKAEQFIDLGTPGNASENPFQVLKEIKELKTNYRSYSEVIDFNNQFFQHTAHFLQNEDYKKLFIEGNKQLTTNKKGGYVALSFLEKDEEKEEDALKYPKKVLEIIQQLDPEFSLSDVCVLVRKKDHGVAVANYLSENGIAIVSSETLLLSSSSKVNFIINFLQTIQHPQDKEALLDCLYFLHSHYKIQQEKHQFISNFIRLEQQQLFSELNSYGLFFELSKFHQKPFYEKVEEIIRSFQLIQASDAYVQFFLDVVLEQQRKGTSIQEFLDFWEDKKEKLSIVAPDAKKAVRVMTIHKSKGLEFPVVIFPYDLNIYKQINPKAWLDELPEIFHGFPELLVDYSKSLSYINDKGLHIFNTRREAQELDNFNLLYVALTRSVEQLYIITAHNVKSDGLENTNFYSGVFIHYLKEKNFWQEGVFEYSFGEKKKVSSSQEERQEMEIQQEFISTSLEEHNILMLANSSKLWNTAQGKAIDFGNLIHEMMSKVITENDIEKVVKQYIQHGFISKVDAEEIEKIITKIVTHKSLISFFRNESTVFNEREIVDVDNQIMIPDRLVLTAKNEVTIIDYKTGKPSKRDHQQLLKYEQVLKKMHFKVGQKLLVYINEEIDIVEVSSKK
ncbi:UvrD-helicase domain-containing protein [Polaribacter sp.]|nr:UvrD-helicase domain-containing protein [Polaribacter sp.]